MAVPNFKKDTLYDSLGLRRMVDSYLKKNESSPQERLATVSNLFGTDENHSRRLYKYASNHWLSFSTPILNYDEDNKTSYPISCYLVYLPDKIEEIILTQAETNWASVCGGGVSIKTDMRSYSKKSVGVMTHLKTYDSNVSAFKQGTRRGSYAIYMDIDNPEIEQFIDMRRSTGDYNMRCLNIHHAVNISDKFMSIIDNFSSDNSKDDISDDWELVDPTTKEIKSIISAKYLWQKILNIRMETGEPYICYIDTCNKYMNSYQKQKGLKINQSNLCTEIIVPTDRHRSSLCCLASLNMEYYDKWCGNEKFIQDVMEMLDNVINKFIIKAEFNKTHKFFFNRVLESAKNERNIGMGILGFHSYLQSKCISIEDNAANEININLFKWLKHTTEKYNKILGSKRGSPNDIIESGNRFAYTMAVAPNATSSIIMGNTSPSIEPYTANIYRQDTTSGSGFNKNKNLEKLFIEKGFGQKLREKLWSNIIINNGSVQHLQDVFLTKHEKNVYKTFIEIDQMKLIKLASERQQYIDQAQSINICLTPDVSKNILHDIHLKAWKLGLKTLYYCRSTKIASADKLNTFEICESCQS